ncbi:MAG: hypothetical protein GMKNLPBB_01303 [Myxococcota bacterium]|nr:hypothetical protein [Myxococcota bacterium]
MSPTAEYIQKLSNLQEGERSRLRRLAGRPLDETLPGFDLFTGLWWPLRKENQAAPRREPSWLVAKLFGAFPVPSGSDELWLPVVLGRCEPRDENGRKRFRQRFDALLCSSLSSLEPHLRWALGEAARAVAGRVPHARDVNGIDWVKLLDHLSIWDRGEEHRLERDVRDIWAEKYLGAANSKVPDDAAEQNSGSGTDTNSTTRKEI